ncbi:MAG: GNAT family N-acetyltransferase [Bacteroidia bacterium]|nr:GNAT family N-acetyltransferase [Bacteroidia bacterium]
MLHFKFDPFPNLETSRLLLRRINESDMDDLFLMRSNPEIMRYIPRPIAQKKEDVMELISRVNDGILKNESINWAIALKETNQLIGTIGYVRSKPEDHRAEVGYMLNSAFHCKGFTFEALEKVIEYGFENMNLHSIEAIIDPRNIASEKLLLKCNFNKEAHLKENVFWNNEYSDSVIYSLLNNR